MSLAFVPDGLAEAKPSEPPSGGAMVEPTEIIAAPPSGTARRQEDPVLTFERQLFVPLPDYSGYFVMPDARGRASLACPICARAMAFVVLRQDARAE